MSCQIVIGHPGSGYGLEIRSYHSEAAMPLNQTQLGATLLLQVLTAPLVN